MQNNLSNAMIDMLQQGLHLLESLTDADYIANHPVAMDSSIGGHYRHVLEHVEPLLDTPPDGLLDYDARPRDPDVETNRLMAMERTRNLIQRFEVLPDDRYHAALRIRNRVSSDDHAAPVAQSSWARESIYAVAHAVHHYALIRMICNLKDISLPENFGFATSTLHHRKTLQSH